jgi:thioredoxin reductase
MKTYDAIVVGGSYAGLSAALQLARAPPGARDRCRRAPESVAASSHGFLTRDGEAPATIAALGRDQLLAYPTVWA